jgi:RNase H-like domain found in reverse transcriptase
VARRSALLEQRTYREHSKLVRRHCWLLQNWRTWSGTDLAVDASGTYCGAVLQQHVNGDGVSPLGFFSVKLDPAQQKYLTFDRELLVCYLADQAIF